MSLCSYVLLEICNCRVSEIYNLVSCSLLLSVSTSKIISIAACVLVEPRYIILDRLLIFVLEICHFH